MEKGKRKRTTQKIYSFEVPLTAEICTKNVPPSKLRLNDIRRNKVGGVAPSGHPDCDRLARGPDVDGERLVGPQGDRRGSGGVKSVAAFLRPGPSHRPTHWTTPHFHTFENEYQKKACLTEQPFGLPGNM